jgi:hypothetical protein
MHEISPPAQLAGEDFTVRAAAPSAMHTKVSSFSLSVAVVSAQAT